MIKRLFHSLFHRQHDPLLAEIIEARSKGDPYAHHWIGQTNDTMKCHKCGEVNSRTILDDNSKCMWHTDRSSVRTRSL